jgi:hypothetical protein
MVRMRVQKRGRFSTLLNDDGTSIQHVFCTTLKKVTCSKDTLYAHLDVPEDVCGFLEDVDASIRSVCAIEYSPYLRGANTLVVKKSPTCDRLPEGQDVPVEVEVRLGNFGKFGYCWTLVRCFQK